MNLSRALKAAPQNIKIWWKRQTPVDLTIAFLVEFSIPLIILVLMYLSGIKSETIAQWRNGLLGFFVVAWFTGQIVRVNRELDRKRAASSTEERLITLSQELADRTAALMNAAESTEKRLISMSNALADQTAAVISSTTGGNSRLEISATIADASHRAKTRWSLILEFKHTGDFPVYDVIFDAREMDNPSQHVLGWLRSIIIPGTIEHAVVGEFPQGRYAFDGWLVARNFRYRVEIQIALSNQKPCVAIQYGEIGGKFIEKVPEDFPKSPDGKKPFNVPRPSSY